MKTNQVSTSKPLLRRQKTSAQTRKRDACAHFLALYGKYERALGEWNARWSRRYQMAVQIDRKMEKLNAFLAETARELQPMIDRLKVLEGMQSRLGVAAVRVLEQRVLAQRAAARRAAKAVRVPRKATT
jgi:hypothetical protein